MTLLQQMLMRECANLGRNISLQILTAGVVLFMFSNAASAQLVYKNDFDHYSAERVYTDSDLDKDWNNPNFNDGVTDGRVSIVRGTEAYGGTGSSLAVSYPAGKDGTKNTGAQWQLEFDADLEEVVLNYRIKFKSGFDFVRGGKLPGLAGGTAPTGNVTADGFNGWTGRMMWRTSFDGVSGQPPQLTSNAISYAKYTDSGFNHDGQDENEDYWTNPDDELTTLQSGVWYKITQRVKMNQPGVADGILQIWIDDVLVIDQQDKLFRLSGEFAIDQMYFSTFFGGNEDWKTSKDEVVYFDDFEITRPDTDFIKVPSHYPTIQAAIDAAKPGDTVAVKGRHTENVILDKTIFLRGYRGTWITAADRSQPCITVTANNAHIKRFETRFGSDGLVVFNNHRNVEIEFITARYCKRGVRLKENCHGSSISKCYLYRLTGDGIRVTGSDNVTVSDNTAVFNDGIGFVFADSNELIIDDNLAYTGKSDGFLFSGSNNIVFDNRSMFNEGKGFLFQGSNNTVTDNQSWRCGGDGFDFEGSSNNLVQINDSRYNSGNGYVWRNMSNNNVIADNTTRTNVINGYLIEMSEQNTLDSNVSDDNDFHGFRLTSTSFQNHLEKNHSEDNLGAGYRDEGVANTFYRNSLRRNGQ